MATKACAEAFEPDHPAGPEELMGMIKTAADYHSKLVQEAAMGKAALITVRVENFEVFLISRFSWVADDTKIIHVEGGEIF